MNTLEEIQSQILELTAKAEQMRTEQYGKVLADVQQTITAYNIKASDLSFAATQARAEGVTSKKQVKKASRSNKELLRVAGFDKGAPQSLERIVFPGEICFRVNALKLQYFRALARMTLARDAPAITRFPPTMDKFARSRWNMPIINNLWHI